MKHGTIERNPTAIGLELKGGRGDGHGDAGTDTETRRRGDAETRRHGESPVRLTADELSRGRFESRESHDSWAFATSVFICVHLWLLLMGFEWAT